jgi:hypothetical protein
VTEATDALALTENVLRELIQDVMQARYGADWMAHLGVTAERIGRWEERRVEEGQRRSGAVTESRLLWFADFTDLWVVLKKNWELFKDCFGDLKRLEVYLDRLSELRNPGAHSRVLLPFEVAEVEGMTGALRQQVNLYRAAGGGGPEPEYFPRIEELWDSYGNRLAGVQTSAAPGQRVFRTDLTLRPGDSVQLWGSAWDPEGSPVHWTIQLNRGPTIHEELAVGFRCTWRVEERDIAEDAIVSASIRSTRSYHRTASGKDDYVILIYRVLPPR